MLLWSLRLHHLRCIRVFRVFHLYCMIRRIVLAAAAITCHSAYSVFISNANANARRHPALSRVALYLPSSPQSPLSFSLSHTHIQSLHSLSLSLTHTHTHPVSTLSLSHTLTNTQTYIHKHTFRSTGGRIRHVYAARPRHRRLSLVLTFGCGSIPIAIGICNALHRIAVSPSR
jgi:hypothetical protein